MTCDSGRPCKRCIQRGLDSTCEDAPRKRKKYLQDVPNSSLMSNHSMNSSDNLDSNGVSPMQPTLLQPMPPVQELSLPTNIPNQSQVPSQSPNTAMQNSFCIHLHWLLLTPLITRHIWQHCFNTVQLHRS